MNMRLFTVFSLPGPKSNKKTIDKIYLLCSPSRNEVLEVPPPRMDVVGPEGHQAAGRDAPSDEQDVIDSRSRFGGVLLSGIRGFLVLTLIVEDKNKQKITVFFNQKIN
jgi:hypothetical protein